MSGGQRTVSSSLQRRSRPSARRSQSELTSESARLRCSTFPAPAHSELFPHPTTNNPSPMRTYPIRNEAGVLFAFEIDAPLLGRRLARVLAGVAGVSDVRRRRWWRGSPDVHIRFRYHEREFIVSE